MKVIYVDGDLLVHHAVAPSTIWKVGMRIFKTKKAATNYWMLLEGGDRITKRYIDPSPYTIKHQLDNMIKTYLHDAIIQYINQYNNTQIAIYFKIVLKGDSFNYRRIYAKTIPYKANRSLKPYYYSMAREYLHDYYSVVYAQGEESDDVLGIEMMKGNLVISMDKDMRTVPGLVYDPYKGVLYDNRESDADKAFYTQLLTGDRADNIDGLYGVGPVRAGKILDGATNKKDMLYRVLSAFQRQRHVSPRRARDMVDELGKLLYIRRKPGEIWSVEGVLYE